MFKWGDYLNGKIMSYSPNCHYSIRLLDKLYALPNANQLDFCKITEAIIFAKRYHAGQYRKSGEPFYSHPIEVAFMIVDYIANTNVIVASILHDVIEDTEATFEIVHDKFGLRVAEIVELLTRDKPNGAKLTIKEILHNAYIKEDEEALLIKCLDRLHNIRTIEFMNTAKQVDTALETINDIVEYAQALSFVELEKELNLLSAKIAMPEQVDYLNKLYSKTFSYGKYQLASLD